MRERGFYINNVFFNTWGMDARTVHAGIEEVVKTCYDEFAEWLKSIHPEEKMLTVEFGKKLDLYERIRIEIKRLVDDIDKRCYGNLYTPLKAFLRHEDDKLIFRCADTGKCFIDDDPDDIHNYMNNYVQVIEPIILPVTLEYEDVNVIEIKDISGKWITYKNPEKVEYVNNHSNILIEDKGIEHVIRFAEVKRFTLNLYRIELNKE